LEEETAKSEVQIRERISKIEMDGHFGDHKDVGDDIWELRARPKITSAF
jgi:putative component of toxin-antitoxin plasmid stabilization module